MISSPGLALRGRDALPVDRDAVRRLEVDHEPVRAPALQLEVAPGDVVVDHEVTCAAIGRSRSGAAQHDGALSVADEQRAGRPVGAGGSSTLRAPVVE